MFISINRVLFKMAMACVLHMRQRGALYSLPSLQYIRRYKSHYFLLFEREFSSSIPTPQAPCARQGFQFLICTRWPLHGQKGHGIPFTTPTSLWSLRLAFCNVTLWKSYWKLDVWSLCCNMKMKDFIIYYNLFSCCWEKIDVGHS